jgi:hypothetical protein
MDAKLLAVDNQLKIHLIEWLVDNPKIRDKQQFVQLNQAMLIRLIDKLYSYKKETFKSAVQNLYETISEHLENTLNFIEDFFSNHFDRNERVPATYLNISLEELCKKLEQVKGILNENDFVDNDLSIIITNNFNKFCYQHAQSITYNELIYQKDLMDELLTDETLKCEQSIKEVLFYFNFNDAHYISYLYKTLSALTRIVGNRAGKNYRITFRAKDN